MAKLALKTGRPVRMVFSREESLIASYKRDPMRMKIRLGADTDGTLRACKFDGLIDSGAYASESPFTAWRASIHAMGAYRYDACDVDVTCVYTNNGYYGAFRGFGNTEVCSAIEQAVDEMADGGGHGPAGLPAARTACAWATRPPHGQTLTESVGPDRVPRTPCAGTATGTASAREYRQQTGELRRGIGVAAFFHGTSLGAEGARLRGQHDCCRAERLQSI